MTLPNAWQMRATLEISIQQAQKLLRGADLQRGVDDVTTLDELKPVLKALIRDMYGSIPTEDRDGNPIVWKNPC